MYIGRIIYTQDKIYFHLFRSNMLLFPIFIVFSSLLCVCTAETIKLENKTHILCVTDYDGYSALYVYPPVVEHGKNSSILIENDGFWNDWVLKNSKDVVVPMVTDRRWEDFETIYTDSIYYPSVANLALSTTCKSTSSTTGDLDPISKKTKRDIDFVTWTHSATYLSINKTDVNNFKRFKFNETARIAPKLCYWKIHDYNIRWAESSSETETVVTISPDDVPCVDLYIYLCSHCTLEVRLGENILLFEGSTQKKWTRRKLSVNVATNLTISRSTTTSTNTTVGQWAVDIRQCLPTKSNKRIYGVSLKKDVEPGVNRTCQFTFSVSLNVRTNPDVFSCSRGLLGRACDISCKELLGSDLRYCQKHQICENSFNKLSTSQCFCAWGYKGSACDEECDPGSAGLSCLRH